VTVVDTQNLIYALIQVIHNFGAATVIGMGTYGLIRQWRRNETASPRTPLLILAVAWAVQGASGAMFGAASLYFNGELPDIHGIAVEALIIKMACVVLGFILAVIILRRNTRMELPIPRITWPASLILGATALSAAAFLRWFS
jgi:hypothetical protein